MFSLAYSQIALAREPKNIQMNICPYPLEIQSQYVNDGIGAAIGPQFHSENDICPWRGEEAEMTVGQRFLAPP